MLRWVARSSRSNGTHFNCLPCRGVEKNASGCHCPLTCCSSTPPMAMMDASTVRANGASSMGWDGHGGVGESVLGLFEGIHVRVRPLQSLGFSSKRLVEWTEDGCDMRDEPAVVVEGTKVSLQFLDGGWCRDLADGIDLLWVWRYPLGADVVAEKLERGGAEDSLGAIDYKAVCHQLFEDTAKVLCALLLTRRQPGCRRGTQRRAGCRKGWRPSCAGRPGLRS